MMSAKFLSLSIVLLSGSISSGDSTEQALHRFHKNPYQAMGQLAPEIIDGKIISRGPINPKAVELKLDEKVKIRDQIMQRSKKSFHFLSLMGPNDQATILVEDNIVNSQIIDLDRQGLTHASLSDLPWADSYWPIYQGILGARYADPKFPDSKIWFENYNYFLSHPTSEIIAFGSQTEINNLSPAEKYDLLVGDKSMALTQFSWAQGQHYLNQVGFVETWMGICHGWAAAAHMMQPVINNSIRLKTADGISIQFYQSDVKALQSMLWANSSPPARFSGTACKISKPERDHNGRVIEPACLDNNPATFFLTLTNQLGIHQRSFIMDATYDVEVWNYPITSYKMSYFNPQSLHPTGSLRQATISIDQFTIDKFRQYRSAEAKYIVGIITDVTFVIEINPTHSISNKPPTKTLRFLYDLELDVNQNVIGGEWYLNSHPDFLWTYDRGAQARARGDSTINSAEWDVSGPVPAAWTSIARQASSVGSPLYSVIRRIIESAPREDPLVPPAENSPESP